eukprot:scaffold869_cov160-Ochromonas_danica.AAC.1
MEREVAKEDRVPNSAPSQRPQPRPGRPPPPLERIEVVLAPARRGRRLHLMKASLHLPPSPASDCLPSERKTNLQIWRFSFNLQQNNEFIRRRFEQNKLRQKRRESRLWTKRPPLPPAAAKDPQVEVEVEEAVAATGSGGVGGETQPSYDHVKLERLSLTAAAAAAV